MKISTYVNNNHIKLSSEEIWKLFEDKETNKEIISRTQLPMILKMAYSFSKSTGNDIEELFSIGLLTLMESIDDYDLSKNRPFVSYYKVRVNNALIDYNNNTIRIPLNKQRVDKIFTTTTPFSKLEYDFENVPDEDIRMEIEKEYNPTYSLSIINKYCTKYQAHVIIEKLGITGDTKEIKDISKETGKSRQNIQMLYNNGIKRIKNNWKK